MGSRHLLGIILATGVIVAPVSQASAERIKQNSAAANKAFKNCRATGGGQVEDEDGVTSCFGRDGHGIVCGGPKREHKGSCDTFRRAGDAPDRPTNVERMRRVGARAPAR